MKRPFALCHLVKFGAIKSYDNRLFKCSTENFGSYKSIIDRVNLQTLVDFEFTGNRK